MRVTECFVLVALALGSGWSPLASALQSTRTTFPEQKSDPDSSSAANSRVTGPDAQQGEADGDFARKRNEWFIRQRAYPHAHIPPGARENALRQHLLLKQSARHSVLAVPPAVSGLGARPDLNVKPTDSFASLTWKFDGPSLISSGAGQTPYSGRATSLAINPTNPLIMYLGTAAGGVWITTDGGQTWAPLTDSQPSLAIGALAIDPNNPNTIYAGTGEADYSGDSYYGEGLLKSTDGGSTWTQISAPFVNTSGAAAPFAQIAIQPGNSSVLLAATESGVYHSTDAGATWTNQLPSYASAVIFDPTNANVAYVGMNGYFNSIVLPSVTAAIYKSTDGGVTWTALTGSTSSPLPSGKLVWRTSLYLDSAGNLLAGLAPSSGGSGTPYKSTDGGNTWTALTAPGDGLDWYRDWLVSVPGSPNVLYTGGVDLFQSLDGGVTWSKSTESYATLLWADQHAAVFSPNGSTMYIMDDGGIFATTTPTATNPAFSSLNNSIGSMTFYPGFGITGKNSSATIVGSQDHGTQIGTSGSSWSYTGGGNICGDGGPVVMDSAGVYAYAHCEGSPLSSWMSSATGGAVLGQPYPYGWVSAEAGITTTDRTYWVPPIATDPSNATNVYTGTYRVYQSTNHAAQWTPISGDLTAGQAALNTIAVAPSDANTIYTGAGDGTVSVTNNALAGASATWMKLSGLPNRSISKIVVTPDSPQDVYVVVSGFGAGHIFHSANGGTTWSDLSGNLPDTPADSVAVDPSLLGTIYLATDTGVYVTSNGGTNWEVLGSNLPNVVVQDIQLVPSSRLLRVVTHGRGAWDTTLPLSGFDASANLLAFGSQLLNTPSGVQTVTLRNDFTTAVSVTGITVSPGWSQSNTCGSSLISDTTCTVSVTFTPTVLGSTTGTLAIQSPEGNISVSLTGTGVAPAVAFSVPSVSFAAQPLGLASSAQATSLENTGTAPLTGIAVSITGTNASDFAKTTACGATLAAGSNCSISIVFTPSAAGSRAATLTVADSASGSPQTVALQGTGVIPFALSANPSSASVAQGATANYSLTFTAAAGTSTSAGATLSCAGLPSESNCTFTPASIPAGTSSQTVTLAISTTAATASLRIRNLEGRATAVFLCGILALLLLPRSRRRNSLAIVILMLMAGGIAACNPGSSTPSNPGTTIGTSTVTVSAKTPTYTASQALTLKVTQ
jgi:photosystem II stability/assembly factor-like uncharacterized protein